LFFYWLRQSEAEKDERQSRKAIEILHRLVSLFEPTSDGCECRRSLLAATRPRRPIKGVPRMEAAGFVLERGAMNTSL
jgi:hypothetical protein